MKKKKEKILIFKEKRSLFLLILAVKIEQIFNCNKVKEEWEVHLVTLEWGDYAILGWDQPKERVRCRGKSIDIRKDLKSMCEKNVCLLSYKLT